MRPTTSSRHVLGQESQARCPRQCFGLHFRTQHHQRWSAGDSRFFRVGEHLLPDVLESFPPTLFCDGRGRGFRSMIPLTRPPAAICLPASRLDWRRNCPISCAPRPDIPRRLNSSSMSSDPVGPGRCTSRRHLDDNSRLVVVEPSDQSSAIFLAERQHQQSRRRLRARGIWTRRCRPLAGRHDFRKGLKVISFEFAAGVDISDHGSLTKSVSAFVEPLADNGDGFRFGLRFRRVRRRDATELP